MPNIISPFTAATDRGYKFLRVFDQYYTAKGGRLVLYVEGGVAPYDWVVTGTDFTLDEAQTTVQYNFVTCSESATLDNTETVTITDAEGSTAEIVVCTCNTKDDVCSATLDSCSAIPTSLTIGCKSVLITAVGGCPPYHWEITESTGDVELAAEYTNKPVNKVKCIDADCRTTGCTFTVSVTDTNSDNVECGIGCGFSALSIDESATDDTVDNSTPAAITITGGVSPFTWEVSGTGFSITPDGESTSKSATVTVVGGTCGVNYTATAIVTITDSCGSSVSKWLRHTGGSWEGIGASDNTGGCAYLFCQCTTTVNHSAVYHTGVGTGGAYFAKWDLLTSRTGCLPACDSGCQSSKTEGSGSDCGADTLTRAAAGISSCPTACWLHDALYYWTCGSACS